MMAEQPPLNHAERADLVAYLDGELDEKAARALETKLRNDPTIRAEAEAFRQTWDLLEYLPKAEASAAFTHRTLERVSAIRPASVPIAQPVRKRSRSWAFGIGWAAALLLATAAGYAAVRLFPQHEPAHIPEPLDSDPQLVKDLRVIEHLPELRHVDNVEFLRALDQPDLFGEDALGN